MSRSFLSVAFVIVTLSLGGCGPTAQGETVAATVNGRDISMVSYQKQVSYQRTTARDNYNFDVCSTAQTKPLCAAVKRSALKTLTGNVIVNQYADAHHIVVSDAEFNRQWGTIDQESFHDQPRLVSAYAKRYGWTPGELMASVRQDLLQKKVTLAITKNMSRYTQAIELSKIDVSTQKQMTHVQSLLRSGQSFGQVAAMLNGDKKSLCHSEGGCGKPVWLPTAFVPAGDRSVLSARIGAVAGPFTSHQLFELLRVQARNPHYAMSPKEQYQLRQQVFAVWLDRQVKHASITQHVHP